ncbi:FAD-binding protein [Gemmiger formicilis]|uniref:FAD-binding protein n=1 Tax=Gemmiger formicilis TaxID=745368 RepID=UPI001956A4E8|nr:FAD-binding protein [Gemmiger formicilis]MBM6916614.1 FAD-binding protein [Gemmiger formicilis]
MTLVAKVILYYLEQAETYETTWAHSGGEAFAHAREYFDVILLDILLPDADGVELCGRLRNRQTCPILFISCLDNSDTIVQALEAGGDDFITKPFDNKVLEARIQASLRRFRQQGQTPAGPGGRCGDFCLDAAGRTVSLPGGGQAHLSATEYRILSFLMEHIGQCFTTRELYVRIWGEKSLGDTRTVVMHIHNLRAKIAAGASETDLTVFSTPELHIFQTYYGGLRLRNDHSYWIYSDIDLVRQFVEQIGDTKAWMADQGSTFDWGTTCNTLIGCMWQRINTFVGGTVDGVEDDSKYGCYFAVPINTVLKANEANEVMYRTTAKSLITDDTGRVTGVTCEMYDGTPVTLHANKAVILATGGYGANIDMVLETNEYWNKDELSANILTTNRSLAQGEGITMAQEVGAAVTGMGFTQLMPLGWADDGKLAGGKGEDVIFVSPAGTENEGKRFVDESAERDVLSQGQLTYGGENGLTIQLQNGGEHTSADNREGKEYFCTLAEAAELTGISADTLRETIMEYDTAYFNGDLASLDVPKSAASAPIGNYNEDGSFNDEGILSVRYLAPSTHHTMGGLVVDEQRHVLTEDGSVIPGLYAAGEVTGGFFAGNRLGGNAISEILVSGRIAGQAAAAE